MTPNLYFRKKTSLAISFVQSNWEWSNLPYFEIKKLLLSIISERMIPVLFLAQVDIQLSCFNYWSAVGIYEIWPLHTLAAFFNFNLQSTFTLFLFSDKFNGKIVNTIKGAHWECEGSRFYKPMNSFLIYVQVVTIIVQSSATVLRKRSKMQSKVF